MAFVGFWDDTPWLSLSLSPIILFGSVQLFLSAAAAILLTEKVQAMRLCLVGQNPQNSLSIN